MIIIDKEKIRTPGDDTALPLLLSLLEAVLRHRRELAQQHVLPLCEQRHMVVEHRPLDQFLFAPGLSPVSHITGESGGLTVMVNLL